MARLGGYSKSQLIKKFVELGPYLRSEKCQEDYFFFDCLAVCVNVKSPPEKREFWGWWLELVPLETHFTYRYTLGLFDKQGVWCKQPIDDLALMAKLEQTLQNFYATLVILMTSINIVLLPEDNYSQELLCLKV